MVPRFSVRFIALAFLLLPACSGPVSDRPQEQQTPNPPAKDRSIQQSPTERPGGKRRFQDRAAITTTAVALFDMGQEGEAKYKGKVVRITGKVDIQGTKRPAPGGTTPVVLEGDSGEPPYAIATVSEDSVPLLFS